MNFFFDNMVPKAVPEYLQELSRTHRVIHKQHRFPKDTPDEVWLSELAEDGHWIIVTIDYRITSTAHVAAALRQAGHTAFFLTKGWGNLPIEQLSWKYPRAWWRIVESASRRLAQGSWFVMGPGDSKPKLHKVQSK